MTQCPVCKKTEKHNKKCKLIRLAREYYEDDDYETIIPDDAEIEIIDGDYRVAASVYISGANMEDV